MRGEGARAPGVWPTLEAVRARGVAVRGVVAMPPPAPVTPASATERSKHNAEYCRAVCLPVCLSACLSVLGVNPFN